MPQCNVLRVNAVEEQAAYRGAVAEILRNVQNDEGKTLLEISERIDVSLGTISNAANKKADLNPIYLNRIGQVFGPHYLDPYAALAGGRMVARDPDATADILPLTLMVGQRIAEARSSNSPGGVREILPEKLAYLPELRRLHRESGALICQIERERDAA
jgi:transcriptional regulator with XRE-family HTH domain